MRVTELWRFPVKSLQGERIGEAVITKHGVLGDRQWGIVDLHTGFVLTCRREPRLLEAHGRLDGDGGVVIELPGGHRTSSDEDLSEWLGRRVELWRPAAHGRATYETPLGLDEQGEWVSWEGPEGSFHDSRRRMLSLGNRATMRDWDPRRFRLNVLLDGDDGEEDALVGSTVTIGGATVEVTNQVDRCIVVTRPQPGGIERDLGVLRTINQERATNLGVAGLVQTPGRVRVGDELTIV